MHSTLEEITAWVRSIELPSTTGDQAVTESFYEEDTVTQLDQHEPTPRYEYGRKVIDAYPTPPSTPPPAAFLTQSIGSDRLEPASEAGDARGSAKTIPWAAAFMAGT